MAAAHYENGFILFGYSAPVGNAVDAESAAADDCHPVFCKAARNLLGSLNAVLGRLSCADNADGEAAFVKAGNIAPDKKRKRIVLNAEKPFRVTRIIGSNNAYIVLFAVFKHAFAGADIGLLQLLKTLSLKTEKPLGKRARKAQIIVRSFIYPFRRAIG